MPDSFFKVLNQKNQEIENDSIDIDNENNFNIFNIISEKPLREEFHSKFLKNLLSKDDNPEYGTKLFELFIECLNEAKNEETPEIKLKDFNDYIVKNEKEKIDILIEGEDKDGNKNFIIIENKINGAPDQKDQLIRYYNKVSKRGSVKAVIYLPLLEYKTPKNKHQFPFELSKLLIELPVYKKSGNALISLWLNKAIEDKEGVGEMEILQKYKSYLFSSLKDELELLKVRKFLDFLEENNIEKYNKLNNKPKGVQDLYDLIPKLRISEIGRKSGLYSFYNDWNFYKQADSQTKNAKKTWCFKFMKPIKKTLPNVIRITSNRDEGIVHLWGNVKGHGNLDMIESFLQNLKEKEGIDLKFKPKKYSVHKNIKDLKDGYIREFITPTKFLDMEIFIIKILVPELSKIAFEKDL